MTVPRDLSNRMLEAVDEMPIVDVYERLIPESRRVAYRVDLIAWLAAAAQTEIQALGLRSDQLALLADVNASPDGRWALLATHWPSLRTTRTGRIILRVLWDLFGVEDLNPRTWKEVSAQLWKRAESGFYGRLLAERAHIGKVLVDGPVDGGPGSYCVPLRSIDDLLAVNCRARLELWVKDRDQIDDLTLEGLDELPEQVVQQSMGRGCVGLKLTTLPAAGWSSSERVTWALGRVQRNEEATAPIEPELQSYLAHGLLAAAARAGMPVQVHVVEEAQLARLEMWARRCPDVRWVGVCAGAPAALGLGALGRTLPNVTLALAGVWGTAPHLARQALRSWLQGIPSTRIFAAGGETTMVEALCIHVQVVREQVAQNLAEMVTAGELDEPDALLVAKRLLYENAAQYYGGGSWTF